AAETVRAALDGSINSIPEGHLTDRGMSCVTVFGGTGFVGRRVVRHLRESGTRVRIVSRHRGVGGDAGIEQIAADAHDQRSVEAAVASADGVVNAISLYVEHGGDTFQSVCTWKRPPRLQERRGRRGLGGLCTYQGSAPIRPRLRPIFAAAVKVKRPCRPHFPAQSLCAPQQCLRRVIHFLPQISRFYDPCPPLRYSATAGPDSSRSTWRTWRRRSRKFCGRARNHILSTN